MTVLLHLFVILAGFAFAYIVLSPWANLIEELDAIGKEPERTYPLASFTLSLPRLPRVNPHSWQINFVTPYKYYRWVRFARMKYYLSQHTRCSGHAV